MQVNRIICSSSSEPNVILSPDESCLLKIMTGTERIGGEESDIELQRFTNVFMRVSKNLFRNIVEVVNKYDRNLK